MDQKITCGGFEFLSNFDSANLAKVELVPPEETIVPVGKGKDSDIPDVEFNIWTKPDCCGTEFQNSNRTWFYFGMRAHGSGLLVKLNVVDLNKQSKMYSQGMAPVYRVLPGKPHWERIRDRPTYNTDDVFTLSFKFRTPENQHSIAYFAFTYPYSYTDIQNSLGAIDSRFALLRPSSKDDVYYTRECLCYSLEGRRVDLITITSYHGVTSDRETRLKNLFPEFHKPRPFRFTGKKVIFLSARVHPGETPSSFVFNGFLNLLTTRDDQIAIALRRLYVFKLIPCLNPDGVYRGHYRTDTRGVNLNRVYLRPNFELYPSIYAARALIRYYHFGFEKEDEFNPDDLDSGPSCESLGSDTRLNTDISQMSIAEQRAASDSWYRKPSLCGNSVKTQGDSNSDESGLYMYIDVHGHASKKGIFMYGNHFDELERNVECMLLPKLMSINNHNFHFTACNFTERNMYLKDKRDGMSREGSGRVAVLKLTGLVRSYTLECNYNTGRLTNVLPPTVRETCCKNSHTLPMPPKYNPHVYEEVGKALGCSILDLSSQNPLTRLPASEFHSLTGLREWLRIHCANEFGDGRPTAKLKLKNASNLSNQGKILRGALKLRSPSTKASLKRASKSVAAAAQVRSTSVPIERKENVATVVPEQSSTTQPSCSQTTNTVTTINSPIGNKPKPQSKPSKTFSLRIRPRKEPKSLGVVGGGDKSMISKSKGMQTGNSASKQKLKAKTSALTTKLKCLKGKDEGNSSSRVQLREICFIKDADGKKVIAKYNKSDTSLIEDNLIVAWDSGNTQAQVFSQKSPLPKLLTGDPGPSGSGAFRVHNFAKSNSFVKTKRINKRNLRRLSTNEQQSKAEKVARKRKKLKAKQ